MDTTETPASAPISAPASAGPSCRGARLLRIFRPGERSGQAIVEFALVSMAFFMITVGTIDVGRVMYEYHQLTNAVREGARFGKIDPPNEFGIKDRVIETAPTLGLTYGDISRSCTGGCYPGCADVTVEASTTFEPLIGGLFGWADGYSITLSSSATVEAE